MHGGPSLLPILESKIKQKIAFVAAKTTESPREREEIPQVAEKTWVPEFYEAIRFQSHKTRGVDMTGKKSASSRKSE